MSYAVLNGQKFAALVSAVVVTVAVQGGMLASFNHVAEAPQLQAASCRAVTLPTEEMVHARG